MTSYAWTQKNTPVYIPSYMRSESSRFVTYDYMLRMGWKNLIIVVDESEEKKYAERCPQARRILALSKKQRGIGNTRQAILEDANQTFILMDDDINGMYHKKNTEYFGGLVIAKDAFVHAIFDGSLQVARTEVGVGAIIDRYVIARPHRHEYPEYGFMRQCFFIHPSVKNHARFDRVQLFEDIDFSLQCLVAGVPVRIPSFMCIKTSSAARTAVAGGCGATREKLDKKHGGSARSVHHEYWKRLMKLHPQLVKKLPNGKHRIAWSKAFKIGQGVA